MATFHYLHLRVFCHETEDPEKVRQALRNAAMSEKLALEETRVDGSHGNRILILDAELKNAAAIKSVFAALREHDPRGFARLVEELPRRMDEHLNVHLRLDKQAALGGTVRLTTGEDAITVRGKVRSFAAKREGGALESSLRDVEAFLQGLDRS